MLDSVGAAITGFVSLLTLCLSRCRCVVRNSGGQTEMGVGFTDAHLFGPRAPPAVQPPDP